jgi:uncharacterized protein YecT (DUF1311 family)
MSRPGREVLVSALAAAVLASPGSAQGFLNLRTSCQDSASTQAAMTACTETDLLAARDRLYQLVAELRGSLPSPHFSGLDSAQAAWRVYVQTECAWEASAYRGGTMEPMMHSSCLEAATWHRIRELAPLLCGLERAEPRCRASEPYLRQARTSLSRP